MIAILAVSLLLSQSGATANIVDPAIERTDAAYEQMVGGEMQAAITRLEAALAENPGDPALLINLGSAYTETGQLDRAAEAYRAAEASEQRYRLELAGGEWVDSRTAARRALMTLEARGFAMR
jgi:cytochrome c-type biogenesis protein CcmH/NrfG